MGMGAGCQRAAAAGDEIFSESAPLAPSLFFFPFRHLWLTVLFIGVPVVQGTHLQSFFLCTLSELRLGDKQEEEESGGGLSGRERERKRERGGRQSTELTFMNN